MLKLFYVFNGKKQLIDSASYKDRDTPESFLLRYLHNRIGAVRIKRMKLVEHEYAAEGFGVDNSVQVSLFTVEGRGNEAKIKLAELKNELKRIRQEHDELEREKREHEKRRVEQYEVEKMKQLVRADVRKNEDGSWEIGE